MENEFLNHNHSSRRPIEVTLVRLSSEALQPRFLHLTSLRKKTSRNMNGNDTVFSISMNRPFFRRNRRFSVKKTRSHFFSFFSITRTSSSKIKFYPHFGSGSLSPETFREQEVATCSSVNLVNQSRTTCGTWKNFC